MSEEPPPTKEQIWRERLYAAFAISLLLIFAACSGLITVVELPLRLLLGWIWHLVQAVPALLPLWPKLLLPLACLTVSTWLIHRFIRWLITTQGHTLDWRARHTVSATALALLGSAAAIALSGVVHQAVWLADAPWFTNHGRLIERTEAANNIRQLHLAILDFQDQHKRYPDSLAELDLKRAPQLLHQSPVRGEPPEPILYLKPREAPASSNPDDDIAILVSPIVGSGRDWIVVGFTSGATRFLLSDQLPEVLETRRMPSSKKP